MKAKKKSFPDLNKDGKVDKKDILKGRGVPGFKKGGKLSISSKSVSIDPPAGHHWMEEQGRYYLMKGDYKPHPGAVKKAKFKLVDHPKS
jgi:hypothetical protein